MSKTVSNVNGHQQTNNNNNVVNSESSSAAGPYLNFLDFDLNPENNDNKKTTEITTNELDLGKDLQSKQQSQSVLNNGIQTQQETSTSRNQNQKNLKNPQPQQNQPHRNNNSNNNPTSPRLSNGSNNSGNSRSNSNSNNKRNNNNNQNSTQNNVGKNNNNRSSINNASTPSLATNNTPQQTPNNNLQKQPQQLYSLWQQEQQKGKRNNSKKSSSSSSSSTRDSNRRSLSGKEMNFTMLSSGASSNNEELISSAEFAPNNSFKDGEEVVIPRSRGGFTLGRVSKQVVRDTCFFSADVQHPTLFWRVDYQSAGKSFFKEIPAIYIGKIRSPSQQMMYKLEDASNPIPQRNVGERPTLRDLRIVLFSSDSNFVEGEIVLVPRTGGGFSYGQLLKQIEVKCKLIAKLNNNSNTTNTNDPNNSQTTNEIKEHTIMGWRVIIDGNKAQKDVVRASIGKVDLTSGSLRSTDIVVEDDPILDDPKLATKKESEILKEIQEAEEREKRRQQLKLERSVIPKRRTSRRSKNGDHSSDDEGEDNQLSENPDSDLVRKIQEGDEEEDDFHSGSRSSHSSREGSQDDNLHQNNNESVNSTNNSTTKNNKSKKNKESEQAATAPKLQIGGVLAVDKQDLLRKLMQDSKKQTLTKPDPESHLIVIDGPNVAKNHGKDVEFNTIGIKIAIDYWAKKGHDVIAFLPQHYFKRRQPAATAELTLQEFLPKANNLPLLKQLIDSGRVVLTPPQDYDDDYCIEYATLHDACIMTNDRYNDHIERQKDDRTKRKVKKWIREHCISFTFVRDELLPNPKFEFPQRAGNSNNNNNNNATTNNTNHVARANAIGSGQHEVINEDLDFPLEKGITNTNTSTTKSASVAVGNSNKLEVTNTTSAIEPQTQTQTQTANQSQPIQQTEDLISQPLNVERLA